MARRRALQVIEARGARAAIWATRALQCNAMQLNTRQFGEHEPTKILGLQSRCMLVAGQEIDSFNSREILNVSTASFHRSTTFLKLFLQRYRVKCK